MVCRRWQLIRAYVVEFQDHDVLFPTPDTRCVLEVIEEETEVPSLNGPVGGHACLEVHAPGSACTQVRAAAMAIRAHDLTARHFGLNPRKRIALVYQAGDPGRLVRNVVELQDERVRKPAALHLDGPGWWRGVRHAGRQRRGDVPGPDACRAERDSKLACDRPQRLALRAKSSGLSLRVGFPGRHTNICSQQSRTH